MEQRLLLTVVPLVADIDPPQVTVLRAPETLENFGSVLGPDGSTANLISSLRLFFNEALASSTVIASAFELRGAGTDDQFDTGDDHLYAVSPSLNSNGSVVTLLVTDGPLSDGRFRLTALPSITDLAGNPLGGGTSYQNSFTIAGSIPAGGEVMEHGDNGDFTKAMPLSITADPNQTGWYRSQMGFGSVDPRGELHLYNNVSSFYYYTGADEDFWSFTGNAGDLVSIFGSAGTGATAYSIGYQSSSSSSLTYVYDGTLPISGTYYVKVTSARPVIFLSAPDTVNYSFRVMLQRGFDAGEAMTIDSQAVTLVSLSVNSQTHNLQATVGGTLTQATSEAWNPDGNRYYLGELSANTPISFDFRLPAWSTVKPQVRVYRLESHSPEDLRVYLADTNLEDGLFRFVTDETTVYFAEVFTPKSVVIGDMQYVLNPTPQEWPTAEAIAVASGGHLASIHSETVNSALRTNFSGWYSWIGLSDAASEGTFVWSDGSPLDYVDYSWILHNNLPQANSSEYHYVDHYWGVHGGELSSLIQLPLSAVLGKEGPDAQYVMEITLGSSVAPTVVAATPTHYGLSADPATVNQVNIQFSDQMSEKTLVSAAFDLRYSGPDGSLDTADDVILAGHTYYDALNKTCQLSAKWNSFFQGNPSYGLSPWAAAESWPSGSYRLTVLPTARNLVGIPLNGGTALTSTFVVNPPTLPPAIVLSCQLFYNHSSFDGNDSAINEGDDSAIATDKRPLEWGQQATIANYSSFSRGINGVMLDIQNLNRDWADAADFSFLVGNRSDLGYWTPAPTPREVKVRRGAGINGSDRVEVTWDDNLIQNQWVRIMVVPGGKIPVASQYQFFFGSAIGETGDSTLDAKVTAADRLAVQSHMGASPVAVTSRWDFDRDGLVSAADEQIAVRQMSGPTLQLIAPHDPAQGFIAASQIAPIDPLGIQPLLLGQPLVIETLAAPLSDQSLAKALLPAPLATAVAPPIVVGGTPVSSAVKWPTARPAVRPLVEPPTADPVPVAASREVPKPVADLALCAYLSQQTVILPEVEFELAAAHTTSSPLRARPKGSRPVR